MEQVPTGSEKNKKNHDVQSVSFKDDTMILTVDGREYSFSLSKISARLASASRHEREVFEISPSGYGIHWPLVDEDLPIDGLLGIKHHPRSDRVKAAV